MRIYCPICNKKLYNNNSISILNAHCMNDGCNYRYVFREGSGYEEGKYLNYYFINYVNISFIYKLDNNKLIVTDSAKKVPYINFSKLKQVLKTYEILS